MAINITATTETETGNASTTDRLPEVDLDLEHKLEDLIEQHAARPTCKAPSCFSSEAIAYVRGDGDGGEDVPLCRDCRDRYGIEL